MLNKRNAYLICDWFWFNSRKRKLKIRLI